MSVSMYEGQVSRLSNELAGIGRKISDERGRQASATGKVLKAQEGLSKAKTPAQLRQRGSELERAQRDLAKVEGKLSDLGKQQAAKSKSLSMSEGNLRRARETQQKKDDRQADRRRQADLDHIRELEQARRSATRPPVIANHPAREVAPRTNGDEWPFNENFDIALSFAGEQRDYVEMIAGMLKERGLNVFYDRDDEIASKLWGRDLGEVLDWIYRKGSRYCLMFVSSDYARKGWTRHERRSALARALDDEAAYVLPARFDDTELPGLRPTVGYQDLRQIAPATLVDLLVSRLA